MTAPSPPLTDEQVAEIRARVDAATEGPWEAIEGASGGWWIEQPHHATIAEIDIDHMTPAADAEFIAHARTDVPALIADRARLTERLAEVERERDEHSYWSGHYAARAEAAEVALAAERARVERVRAVAEEWAFAQGDLGNDTFAIRDAAEAITAALDAPEDATRTARTEES